MPAIEEYFSKIVRSLLLDVDVHLDQLEQVGYLSKEHRAFLDKFLYKSEDALRAASLVRSTRGSDLPLTKLPSSEESTSRGLALSLSRSENGDSNVASRALPRLRSVTEQLNSDENGLTTFLQRCNARNFSVKVRGTDIAKESPNKVKGSNYILALEPIAEGTAKGDGDNADAKLSDGKSLDYVSHDTSMTHHPAESFPRDMRVESVDYETTIDMDAIANPSSEKIKHTIGQAAGIEPANNDTSSTKAIDITAESVEPTDTKPAVESIKVEPILVKPIDSKHAESQQKSEHVDKFKDADAQITIDQEQSHNGDAWGEANALEDPAAITEEEVETNAWGKPIKSDPTRNKEGAIVGGKAKPLGAENKGRAMMEKMGWSKGTGLGKQKRGILEPIIHVVKNTKTGLRTSEEKTRKTALSPPSSQSITNSTSDVKAEEQSVNLDNVPRSPLVNNSNWDQCGDISNGDEPAKLITKKLDAGVKLIATEKHTDELKKAESETLPAKPQFIGIKALYLREGDSPHLEKTISFKTRIQSTDEHKITMHQPGVIIRAMSPQGSHHSKSMDDSSFNVWTGNALEVLRVHQGDEYHVYSFSKKRRGIVKISLLEMADEPQAVLADVAALPNIPATATAWV